jgi:hypothetical protein
MEKDMNKDKQNAQEIQAKANMFIKNTLSKEKNYLDRETVKGNRGDRLKLNERDKKPVNEDKGMWR